MLTHRSIWEAIDALAERHELSVSGLAKSAGLDPTTFNKSKRRSKDDRERWPSTESLSKILEATGDSIDNFMELAGTGENQPLRSIPMVGLAQAGSGGFFDDDGFPAGTDWDAIVFPEIGSDDVYALEVSGESMLPLYRDGDIVIVTPGDTIRRGDRVVLKTRDGEVMAKILKRKTVSLIELGSLNPDYPDLQVSTENVAWMARITWASQ